MENFNKNLENYITEDFLKITIKVNNGRKYYQEIVDNINIKDLLYQHEFMIKDFLIKGSNNENYQVILVKKVSNDTEHTYWINIYIKTRAEKRIKINKFQKNIYLNNQLNNYIKLIGITKAQIAHAQNITNYKYISLREFLKQNPEEFATKNLYKKNYNNKMSILRHKNLFSTYKDEISDFEKLTYIKRDANKQLILFHELDENILVYNQAEETLLDRKNAREFAKEIYHKKGIYTDKELLKILKNQNIFIQIEEIIFAENKIVWSKVKKSDMNLNVLNKEVKKYYQEKPERKKNYQLKYLSKRNKKRKLRREQKKFVNKLLHEYYHYNI